MSTPSSHYDLVEGDMPGDSPRAPRLITWMTSGPTQMMSEIDDGVFVGWIPGDVDAKGRPIEPEYITRWRVDHLKRVDAPPPAPTTTPEPNSAGSEPLRPAPTVVVQDPNGEISDVGF